MVESPRPVFPDFEHSLPMMLLRAREVVMGRFRPMLRQFDLTEQQWRIIRALAEADVLDAGDLARVCYILAPSLTRILQNLEARGVLQRRTDENDQRRAQISLTHEGRELFDEVRPYSRESYAEIALAIGPDRLSELYEILGDVEQKLKRTSSSA